jgi:hypothetical protein
MKGCNPLLTTEALHVITPFHGLGEKQLAAAGDYICTVIYSSIVYIQNSEVHDSDLTSK